MKFLLDKKSWEQSPEPCCCHSFSLQKKYLFEKQMVQSCLKQPIWSKDQQLSPCWSTWIFLTQCQQDHSLICCATTARKMQTAMAAYSKLHSQTQLLVYAVVNTRDRVSSHVFAVIHISYILSLTCIQNPEIPYFHSDPFINVIL